MTGSVLAPDGNKLIWINGESPERKGGAHRDRWRSEPPDYWLCSLDTRCINPDQTTQFNFIQPTDSQMVGHFTSGQAGGEGVEDFVDENPAQRNDQGVLFHFRLDAGNDFCRSRDGEAFFIS